MAKVIYWFRTDLRLHDSPALTAALELKPSVLWPVWTWDPHYVYHARVSVNRWQFLIECQKDIDDGIRKANPNSKLLVVREAPQTVFPKIFEHWKPTHIVFEKDTDAYARERDQVVIGEAKKAGIEVIVVNGRTLWDPDELTKANGGNPTMSLKQVQTASSSLGEPPKPQPAPKKLPDLGDTCIGFKHEIPSPDIDLNHHIRSDGDHSFSQIAGPKNDFSLVTLEELGIKEKPRTTIHGGESIALAQMDKLFEDPLFIPQFEKPKTAPTQFSPPQTSLLSPHIHFGSLGIRELYWKTKEKNRETKHTEPPVSFEGQLLFREMYFAAYAAIGKPFMGTEGNKFCRYIPWRLKDPNEDDKEAQEWLKRWAEGNTGFPWIDAAMRQLRQEGWIHHLARHAVASFLTRGGCFIAWERGKEVFEEHLLDHEPACNAGNWQWLSCTAFYSMFYRVYSPVKFPQKWDRKGDYIRKYVPELKDLPAKFIYEPWKAPKDQQPQNYPKPMFDFNKQREICMNSMKKAYDAKKYGHEVSYAGNGTNRKSEEEQHGDTTDGWKAASDRRSNGQESKRQKKN